MLLKLGEYDFTQYIQSYKARENEPVEKKRTTASSGYDTITFASNNKTTIEITFAPMTAAQVSEVRLTLKAAGNKATFQYWSTEQAEMREASFYINAGESVPIKPDMTCNKWDITLEQAGTAKDVNSTTVSAFPADYTDKAGTWSNETNAYADDSSYATNPGSTEVGQTVLFNEFDFSSIPENAIINWVEAEIKYHVSTTASQVKIFVKCAYDGTERGVEKTSEAEPLTDVILTSKEGGKWTRAQLQSDKAQVKVWFKRYSSTACTAYLNYVKMRVNYTEVG